MASIFTKIINREIPAQILAESARFIAFLDVNPLVMGHALVVPKAEVDDVFDLDDADLQEALTFARSVAQGIRAVIPCRKVGVSVVGLEVPHAHIHLIPLNRVDDMNFGRPKLKPETSELADLAGAIRAAIKH